MNRRHLIFAPLIALFAAALVIFAHYRGMLMRLELPISDWVTRSHNITRFIPAGWQYALVAVVALAVAWLMITTLHRARVGWLVLAFALEMLGLMWVCAFYRVLFQPLALVLGAALTLGAMWFYLWSSERKSGGVSLAAFHDRVSPEVMRKLRAGEIEFDGTAKAYDGSVLVCDLAGKYDLADQGEAETFAKLSETFTERARAILLEAGAYIEASDGEGIVAIFGFPEITADPAARAVRAAFQLSRILADSSNGEVSAALGVNVGVSSGVLLTAPRPARREIFLMSESVELARRFCVANRFYGSRVLIGPRSFELASGEIVARPIDFLSGVNAQERHEIYEPLGLVANASPELLARRDSFWNGVVLYREKRWEEAYTEFARARGPEDQEDAPLALYLRRLEPLALQLLETPGE